MSNAKTFNGLLNAVKKESSFNSDADIAVKDIEFEDIENVKIGGEKFAVRPWAQKQICRRLKTPHEYLTRCPVALQRNNLDYWLKEEAKERDAFFVRFNERGVRAFLTNRYETMDNLDVLNRLAEVVPKAQKVSLNIDEEFFGVQIIMDQKNDVKVGDVQSFGVAVKNSEVGRTSLMIQPSIFRLVCSNGMVVQESGGSSRRFVHRSKIGLDNLVEIYNRMAAMNGEYFDQIRRAMETKWTEHFHLDDTDKVFDRIRRDHRLRRPERDAAATAFVEFENGDSVNAIIQSITRAANDKKFSAVRAHYLQRVGGDILSAFSKS